RRGTIASRALVATSRAAFSRETARSFSRAGGPAHHRASPSPASPRWPRVRASCSCAVMAAERWTDVDRYLTALLVPSDPALDAALAANAAAGLPPHDVSPAQGKLLHVLARLQGARRILEIGTLGGYSTIWLARALPPDGRLVTLESDPRHAEVARKN